jgi:1-acyl-sn-glycerol-3-phosphate acyltransferase
MGDNEMSPNDRPEAEIDDIGHWDPKFTKQFENIVGPIINRYFRSEVHGVDAIPSFGGALLVSNHSGGMFTPDVLIVASAYYREFGYRRPLFTLAHDSVLSGPGYGALLRRLGLVNASRETAAHALQADGVVLVFPGGDYDVYRPTSESGTIDFAGRKGYVRTAIAAGVPIVPVVSIGGQATQLFLSRGTGLAQKIGLGKLRIKILPVSLGFPFGLTFMFPPNLPLPSKIVTAVLEPIDIAAQFGPDPDVDDVDAYVRAVMQAGLTELASKRRLPILG